MKSSIANLQRAIYLVCQSSPRWTVVGFGLLLIQGILPLAQLYLMKRLIDTLTLRVSGATPATLQAALLWIGLSGLVSLLGDGCSALSKLTQTVQTEAVSDRVHSLLHTKSIQVDLQYYENTDYYNTLHRAQEQATYRPQMVLASLLQLGQSGLSLLGILALLTSLNWMVPLLLSIATIPGILMRVRYTGKAYGRVSSWTESERQSNYFHTLLTTEAHAKEIRLFNLGSLFSQWFQTLRTKIRREKIHLATQQSRIDLITNGSATLAVCVACSITAHRTQVITLDGVDLGDYSLVELRRQISVLFQDYIHYQLTVKENI